MLKKELKKALKQKAHHLKPIIIIGQNGLTNPVHAEITRALFDHELIKIKINTTERDIIEPMITAICQTQLAEFIGQIGHTLIIYKKRVEKK